MTSTSRQNQPSTMSSSPNTPFIFGAIALLIFAVLGVWGGLPPEDEIPSFVIGIIVFIVLTLGLCVGVWHLLVRPLPQGHATIHEPMFSVSQRRWVAVLLGLSAISLTIGSLWDEIWHRTYGIPFGEDLFWRPHLLMYFAFLIVIGLGAMGWVLIIRRKQGSLQQRFRMDPIVGIVTLLGTFLAYSVPADPIWHMIYGEDISAWSIPHIILGFAFTTIAILTALIYLANLPKRDWSGIWKFNLNDVVLLVILSFALTPLLLLFTSEWDSISENQLASGRDLVLTRPDWLLPAFLVFCSSFVAVIANHSLRRVGAGTIAVTLSFLTRVLLIGAFNDDSITANMWLLSIPPAIGIDLCNGYFVLQRSTVPSWTFVAVFSMVSMALIGYPLMNQILLYPQVTGTSLLGMLLFPLIGAGIAVWMARIVGEYAGTANKLTQDETVSVSSSRALLLAPSVLILAMLLIAWFVATATPPIV